MHPSLFTRYFVNQKQFNEKNMDFWSPADIDLYLSFPAYWQCDPRHVVLPLWASVSSSG